MGAPPTAVLVVPSGSPATATSAVAATIGPAELEVALVDGDAELADGPGGGDGGDGGGGW